MSYARWSFSRWYAFWDTSTSGKTKEEQSLALYGATEDDKNWSYAELKGITADALRRQYPEATEDDIKEAMDIIASFRQDVDWRYDEHPEPTGEPPEITDDEKEAMVEYCSKLIEATLKPLPYERAVWEILWDKPYPGFDKKLCEESKGVTE